MQWCKISKNCYKFDIELTGEICFDTIKCFFLSFFYNKDMVNLLFRSAMCQFLIRYVYVVTRFTHQAWGNFYSESQCLKGEVSANSRARFQTHSPLIQKGMSSRKSTFFFECGKSSIVRTEVSLNMDVIIQIYGG